MRPPKTCWRCGKPAVVSVGTRDYCSTDYAELVSTFNPAVLGTNGVGLPCGRVRPEYGSQIEDLRCVACGATWCGKAGERCQFCRAHRERIIAHQREMLLRVPEIEVESMHVDEVLTAWGDRLARAVSAGIVTRDEAERVWRRAVNHVAA